MKPIKIFSYVFYIFNLQLYISVDMNEHTYDCQAKIYIAFYNIDLKIP